MQIDHWMMFGTFAEQRHFVYPSIASYNGIVINANMAAHAPDGLAAFMVEKTPGYPYLIDPMTHAWQHEPMFVCDKDGYPKKALQTLATNYGEPFASTFALRPLTAPDLADPSVLRKAVESVLDFQKYRLSNAMAQHDSMRYLEASPESLRPHALIAPYFYLDEVNVDDWLPLMIKGISLAAEFAEGIPVYGAVVVSKGALTSIALRSRIAAEFVSSHAAGFVLWVDALDEQTASQSELDGLLELAKELREGGRYVLNLHGGYFSILAGGTLGDNCLAGVTHAPEFGEARAVVPVGGGIPIARYYIPDLHSRVRYRDALAIFKRKGWLDSAEEFHSNVCSCEECKKVIRGNADNFVLFGEGNVKDVKRGLGIVRMEYPTAETKLRCLRHYLQRKKAEHIFVASAPSNEQLNELAKGTAKYLDVLGKEGVRHLLLWQKVFDERRK